ncbi:phosphoglycerate mutase [Sulfodiicoccus acidiphilus]|uniref:Phosphoglycerate mutase n=1 Tax=Sulfodiicoccus acidiphilus TaxID=1670455 RepID=A0A348B6Q5_9CREN|nr:histidine phosphatase family protein [Sulfodiicoccus acidiphilus]BBD73857.1 phosphoglycerate mutase [Sulfodiicoccus acidiphilus]GGT96288.1 phosphoglycerate mutase [Sulfodiicoccus acidiphilus]
MIIYFVRHGESEANIKGIYPTDSTPLTSRGVDQARTVGKVLRSIKVDSVISSPALRATQTAEQIAQELGLKVEVDDRFREVGLGSLQGKSLSVSPERDVELMDEYYGDGAKYGIEKLNQLQVRILSGVTEIHSTGKKIVVIVSHQAPIRAAIALALGSAGKWLARIPVENASISIMKFDGGRFSLACVNWKPVEMYS